MSLCKDSTTPLMRVLQLAQLTRLMVRWNPEGWCVGDLLKPLQARRSGGMTAQVAYGPEGTATHGLVKANYSTDTDAPASSWCVIVPET